jgi:predicted lipid-binding transport protein (Tim44 family)
MMTEATSFDFWVLLIFAAIYAHMLQLAIHKPPAGDKTQGRRVDAGGSVQDRPAAFAGVSAGVVRDAEAAAAAGRSEGFDAPAFLHGAGLAYEEIVEAYAQGDIARLRPLVGDEVYAVFGADIAGRVHRGEQLELILVRVRPPQIVESDMDGDVMRVTVRFDSDMVTAVRAASGRTVSGDPRRVVSLTDLWTFARSVLVADPTWRLIATNVG